MKKFVVFAVIAVLAVGGAAFFYPTFNQGGFFADLEPASGNAQAEQDLREVLAESLKRANEALEQANAKMAESNTFSQEDTTTNAQ
ncbi:MAG: hypothetical protein CMH30_01975 [Micavibrio sp.]|nr:hypothetical protein [Micavibrio sp.]|tara:strand:+ start:1007 stop:1264 length:258 start_codon:yes stop_codon:yes gene_type:complete